jgi:hypothetical protein
LLLQQAVRGFELWFGVRPQVTPELRALVEQDLLKTALAKPAEKPPARPRVKPPRVRGRRNNKPGEGFSA